MKKLAVIALMIGIGAVPAFAQNYDFTYTGGGYSMSGVLATTPAGGGANLVNSVTGTISFNGGTAEPLTLVPPDVVPHNDNGDNLNGQDDLVYPGGTPLLTVCYNYGCPYGGLEFAFPDLYAPLNPGDGGVDGGSDIAIYAQNGTGGTGNYGATETGKPANGFGGYDYQSGDGTFTLTAVPDGGTTLTLLGLAVAGLAGLRRKLSK
jgi:hypothetical protein